MFNGAEISGTRGTSLSRFLLRLLDGHRDSPDVEREYILEARVCAPLPPPPNIPFKGLVLWYEGRMDCRALRKVRAGLKLNCEKRDDFWGDSMAGVMSTGGVPIRGGACERREPEERVVMLKALCLGSERVSISLVVEAAIAP